MRKGEKEKRALTRHRREMVLEVKVLPHHSKKGQESKECL